MNGKPAFIKWYGKQNGQERRAELRAGARGQGKVLQVVNYWPHSGPSMESADRIFDEVAARDGYVVVASDRDQD